MREARFQRERGGKRAHFAADARDSYPSLDRLSMEPPKRARLQTKFRQALPSTPSFGSSQTLDCFETSVLYGASRLVFASRP